MRYKKNGYHNLISLYSKQNWLIKKKAQLRELINSCEKQESQNLVISLLERFHYLNDETLNLLLNEIADYIIDSDFNIESTQIVSMTLEDGADSSQKILDLIKMPLFQKGWKQITTVNRFGSCLKNYNRGRTQIILIDEFIGSGKTLSGRINKLKGELPGEFQLKCFFLAGIKEIIDKFSQDEVEIFCPLVLDKGITGYYEDSKCQISKKLMCELERNLAPYINEKCIEDYSFGFGNAEALYSMEGCCGNTPNSVFPIFWWQKSKSGKDRATILTRFEEGF